MTTSNRKRDRHDRGLQAVARVREVREQASLRELQQALAVQRERQELLDHLTTQLTAAGQLEADILGAGSPGALIGLRSTLEQLGTSIRFARGEVATAASATAGVRSRWEQDKSRLRAVEQLLERRAVARAVETDRKIAREADDLAAQGWLRRTTTVETS